MKLHRTSWEMKQTGVRMEMALMRTGIWRTKRLPKKPCLCANWNSSFSTAVFEMSAISKKKGLQGQAKTRPIFTNL